MTKEDMGIKEFLKQSAENERDNIRDIRIEPEKKKKDRYRFEKIDKGFENRALKYMERLLEEDADKNDLAIGLAGLDSEQAWQMREKLINEKAGISVAIGLAGLDNERAWEMRERLIKMGVYKGQIIRGLAGLDSKRAWKMREEWIKMGVLFYREIVISLTGIDTEQAWALREKLIREVERNLMNDEPEIINFELELSKGLAGLDSERAWELREKLYEKGNIIYLAVGLAGIDSEQAWTMRENIMKNYGYICSVAAGLAGLDSERAWTMRRRLLKYDFDEIGIMQGVYNKIGIIQGVTQGLAGLDSKQAWEMRESLKKMLEKERFKKKESLSAKDKGILALGVVGDSTTFVWRCKNEELEDYQEKREPMPVRLSF